MVELELTFLAKKIPEEIQGISPVRILDIYIPENASHAHLRLRQKGEKYVITKKLPVKEGDVSAQEEKTISLTKEEFEALAKCSKKRVVKDRYSFYRGEVLVEVDVFREDLKGLVLVDFEFESEEAKEKFVAPDYVLADVTQESFIAGGVLSGKKYEDLEEKLNEFEYKRIN